MALNSSSYYSSRSCSISTQFRKNPANPHSVSPRSAYFGLTSSSSSLNSDDTAKPSLSVSADSSSAPKARFVARRTESVSVRPLERPLRNVSSSARFFYMIHMLFVCFLLIDSEIMLSIQLHKTCSCML